MHPEVATVGSTEEAAEAQGLGFETICSRFTPLKYGMAKSDSMEAVVKLLVEPETQKILSLHIVAPGAADLVQMLVPALKKGLTLDELNGTILVHPSAGEELFSAA